MEKVALQNRRKQNIVGVLEKPKGKIKGTAIVQHGWGVNKEEPVVRSIKQGVLDAGLQVFIFDATNTFGESDGTFEKSTLRLHWEDLEDVVKWVQQQEWFQKPLALAGHSKGGYSVVRYTEEYPEEVDLLLPVAPVVSGKLSFEAYEKKNPNGLEKWKKDGYITSRRAPDVKKWWFQMEERLQHDLLPSAHKVTVPTLFVVGSKDTTCPFDHVQILCNEIKSQDITHCMKMR